MRFHARSGQARAPRSWSAIASLAVVSALSMGVMGSPAAAGTIRFASPDGTGTACTSTDPCALKTALTKSPGGRTVHVFGDRGTYVQASDITTVPDLTIVGVDGRPSIVFTVGGLLLRGGSIRNLAIEATADTTALSLTQGATASRVWVKASGTNHACGLLGGSRLTNALCWATGDADKAVEIKGGVTLRNVTAYGGTEAGIAIIGYDICACETFTVTLVNTIAHAPITTDVFITTDLPNITLKPTYSNFRSVNKVEDGGDIRVVASATNQTKATNRARFIDTVAGNFRAAAGSPVIDKGDDASANGPTDLDGRARETGGRTDIGAFEYSPPVTTITKGPSGTTSDTTPTFRFTSSRAGATFECRIDGNPLWLVCVSPWTIGWTAGAHTFRVRAVDALGYHDPSPAKRTFTVAP